MPRARRARGEGTLTKVKTGRHAGKWRLVYESIDRLPSCLSNRYSRKRFLSRACRPEVSVLDEYTFAAIGNQLDSPQKIDTEETGSLARLLIRWSSLAQGNQEVRDTCVACLPSLRKRGKGLLGRCYQRLRTECKPIF